MTQKDVYHVNDSVSPRNAQVDIKSKFYATCVLWTRGLGINKFYGFIQRRSHERLLQAIQYTVLGSFLT